MRSLWALGTVAGLASTCLFLGGCSEKSASAAANQPERPTDVLFVTVEQRDVPVFGDWIATLDGTVNANIQPQVGGYLIKQNYREGSLVHKGDVMFEIDPRPFQATLDQTLAQVAQAEGQLAQDEAQLALANINVNRDTPLAAARAIAQSQLDNDTQNRAQIEAQIKTAQANIQTAKAAVEQARLNVGFTQVKSLVDGIAGIASTQVGSQVNATTVLTSVSQVDPVRAYFSITEQEYLALAAKAGKSSSNPDFLRQNSALPLQLTLSNDAVYPHQGRVEFADRQVNSQTGTIRIVGTFPNPGNVLRPGQFGRIRAMTSLNRRALLVPQRAVTELQGRYLAALVDANNHVKITGVEVGDRVGPMWIIRSGLTAGERVVSEGTSKVRDGAAVNPKPDKTPDSGTGFPAGTGGAK
jgi:membrane fusion protein (multidrug efflux system)